MSTLQTVHSDVVTPSFSATSPSTVGPGALRNAVEETLQNNVAIARQAHSTPTPMPTTPPLLETAMPTINAAGAGLKATLDKALASRPNAPSAAASTSASTSAPGPAATPAAPAALNNTVTSTLDPTLQRATEACLALADTPLPDAEQGMERVQARLDKVQQLQNGLDAVPDKFDAAILHAHLGHEEEHLQNTLQCLHLKDLINEQWIGNLQGQSAEQKLVELIDEWPFVLETLQDHMEPAAQLLSPDAALRQKAEQSLEDMGMAHIVQEVDVLQGEVTRAVAQALEEYAAHPGAAKTFLQNMRPECGLQLAKMMLLSSDGAQDVKDILHALEVAHQALGAALPHEQAMQRMEALLQGALFAPDMAQRLGSVDDLFQYCYPEHADLALHLKFQMVGDHVSPLGVQAQHALALGLHAQFNGPDMSKTRDWLHPTSTTAPPRYLTPDLVAQLSRNEGKGGEKVQYQLAHMVLLQSTAANLHCLPPGENAEEIPEGQDLPWLNDFTDIRDLSSREMAQSLSEQAAEKWCQALGMNKATAAYTGQMATAMQVPQQSVRALDHLLEASLLYQKGISDSDAAAKAAHTLYKVGSMSTHKHSERHALALYSSNAAFSARLALDRYLVGLSGLSAQNRLESSEEGLAFKWPTVNKAITTGLTNGLAKGKAEAKVLREALVGSLKDANSASLTEQKASLLKDIRAQSRTFAAHYKLAQELFRDAAQAPQAGDEPQMQGDRRGALLQARGKRASDKADRKENASLRKLLGHNWPHLRAQRKEACELALKADKLRNETVDHTSAEAVQKHEEEMQDVLKKLSGFDRFTFKRVKNGAALAEKDLGEVLDVMLPRAKAVRYFAENGVIKYQAQRRKSLYALNALRAQEFGFKQKVRAAYGKDTYHLVRGAVEAAALGAFLEMRCTPSEFSLNNEDNVKSVMAKLAQWGLEVKGDDAVLKPLLYRALHKVTLGDGTLNFAKLRKNGQNLSLSLRSAHGRAEKKSPLSAYKQARKDVLHSADAATRKEGVRGLMDNVAQPGGGIIIDRTRGVMLDTGALFTPAGDLPVSLRSTRFPLSVQLQLMHSNSIGVVHTAEGYQVLLKDKAMAGAAFNASIGLGGIFKLAVSGGSNAEQMEGLALDFPTREKCENFLLNFMNPDSALHDEDRAVTALRDAQQVRFVSGNGATVQGSVGISAGLLAISLNENNMLTGSVSATASAKRGYTHEVQHNALGQSVTMSKTTVLSATAGASLALINTDHNILTSVAPLSVNRSVNYSVTERYKVDCVPSGISPTTCMEKEYDATALPHLLFLKGLPKAMQQSLHADSKTMDAVYRVGKSATPGMSVTVQSPIRGEVLAQVKELQRQARTATPQDAEQALNKAHALLADENSYAPARLIVKRPRAEKLGHGYCPGLPTLKVVRRDTLMHMRTETIALPMQHAEGEDRHV